MWSWSWGHGTSGSLKEREVVEGHMWLRKCFGRGWLARETQIKSGVNDPSGGLLLFEKEGTDVTWNRVKGGHRRRTRCTEEVNNRNFEAVSCGSNNPEVTGLDESLLDGNLMIHRKVVQSFIQQETPLWECWQGRFRSSWKSSSRVSSIREQSIIN